MRKEPVLFTVNLVHKVSARLLTLPSIKRGKVKKYYMYRFDLDGFLFCNCVKFHNCNCSSVTLTSTCRSLNFSSAKWTRVGTRVFHNGLYTCTRVNISDLYSYWYLFNISNDGISTVALYSRRMQVHAYPLLLSHAILYLLIMTIAFPKKQQFP